MLHVRIVRQPVFCGIVDSIPVGAHEISLSKAMKYSAAVHLYFDTQGISTYKFGCLGNVYVERQQQQQKRK